jgi:methionyl-tRNA synthetase
VRYWLLREVPPTEDADYTDERLERRYTADLANDLGNLLQRTVTLLHRYREGRVPILGEDRPDGGPAGEVVGVAEATVGRLQASLAAGDPREALVAVWDLVGRANRYVEETAPWSLARRERGGEREAGRDLDLVLATLIETLRVIGEALRPLLPRTGAAVLGQIGVPRPAADWRAGLRWGRLTQGAAVGEARPLFPRLPAGATAPAGAPGPTPVPEEVAILEV